LVGALGDLSSKLKVLGIVEFDDTRSTPIAKGVTGMNEPAVKRI
jgi:hypothetical protein